MHILRATSPFFLCGHGRDEGEWYQLVHMMAGLEARHAYSSQKQLVDVIGLISVELLPP